MSKLFFQLLVVLVATVFAVQSQQQDNEWCKEGMNPVSENVKLPRLDAIDMLEVNIERNKINLGETEEITEYYDGSREFFATKTVYGAVQMKAFTWIKDSETLITAHSDCKKQNIYTGSNPFINQPHLVLSVVQLAEANDLSKLPSTEVRGIKVDQYMACRYSEKDKTTIRIKLAYAQLDKWTPAVSMPENAQFPIEVIIETKGDISAREVNSVMHYKPGPFNPEEYATPKGVYCEDRANGRDEKLKFQVPTSFAYLSHNIVGEGLYGELEVQITNLDFTDKYLRYDFFKNDTHTSNIHDYDTGIMYMLNRYTGVCEATTENPELDGEPSNPYQFFQLDTSPQLQYAGNRTVRGIPCSVWIAPRKILGKDVRYEWYIEQNGAVQQEEAGVFTNEPVLLNIYKDKDATPYLRFEISNFDRSRIQTNDFDVGACGGLSTKHLKFNIDSDRFYDMQENKQVVQSQLKRKIAELADVRLIRLSGFEVIYDNGVAFVTFTLVNRPAKYGNLNRPKPDLDLQEAYDKLSGSMGSGFDFQFFSQQQQKTLKVSVGGQSLVEMQQNSGRYVFTETVVKARWSGGAVFGFVAGFLLLGVIGGFVFGLFVILRGSVQLPAALSVLNPSFSKA